MSAKDRLRYMLVRIACCDMPEQLIGTVKTIMEAVEDASSEEDGLRVVEDALPELMAVVTIVAEQKGVDPTKMFYYDHKTARRMFLGDYEGDTGEEAESES